jgi:hypothetical protein
MKTVNKINYHGCGFNAGAHDLANKRERGWKKRSFHPGEANYLKSSTPPNVEILNYIFINQCRLLKQI